MKTCPDCGMPTETVMRVIGGETRAMDYCPDCKKAGMLGPGGWGDERFDGTDGNGYQPVSAQFGPGKPLSGLVKKITAVVIGHPDCSRGMRLDYESIELAIDAVLRGAPDRPPADE